MAISVLVVEDDKHARALLQKLLQGTAALRDLEIKFFGAKDGLEGLECFDKETIDLVISDLLMPQMDGFEMCNALRTSDKGKTVPIIAVSGLYRDAKAKARVAEFGGTFLAKPFQVADMVAVVKSALGIQSKASATRKTTPSTGSLGRIALKRVALVPKRQGELAKTPFAKVAIELQEVKATGHVTLRRGKVEKRIDMLSGFFVGARSNQRSETLGNFLVKRNIITKSQFELALELASNTSVMFGEALIKHDVMDSSALAGYLHAQMQFRIAATARWTTGTFEFVPKTNLEKPSRANAMEPTECLPMWLRDTGNVNDAAQTCAPFSGQAIRPTERGYRMRQSFARAFGQGVVGSLYEGQTLEAMLNMHDSHTVLLAVEALWLTGCIAEPVKVAAVARVPEPTARQPGVTSDSTVSDLASLVQELPPADYAGAPALSDTSSEAGLYDLLFDEAVEHAPAPRTKRAPVEQPAIPEEVPEMDTGVIDLAMITQMVQTTQKAVATLPSKSPREKVLDEFLRVTGKGYYTTLDVDRSADANEISAAFDKLTAKFALEKYTSDELGNDYAKLDDVHAAYIQAQETLLAPDARAAYDAQLFGTPSATRVTFNAELEFRRGEDLLEEGAFDNAISAFQKVIDAQADVADYHAAMGWALCRRAERATDARGRGEDQAFAMQQLETALEIDPEHAGASEYMGRLLVATGGDIDHATQCLTRALNAQPPRTTAIDDFEQLLLTNNRAKTLERQYRKLLHTTHQADSDFSLRLWLSLGNVYLNYLHDRDSARVAYECAAGIKPEDDSILRMLDELNADDPDRFFQRADALVTRWQLDTNEPKPLVDLLRTSTDLNQHDFAFVTASVLVARGVQHDAATKLYRQARPKFLVRAQRFVHECWEQIAHDEDDLKVGALFRMLEPLALKLAPMTLEELELGGATTVDTPPKAFAKVGSYIAQHLKVAMPTIVMHESLADQIHVGVTDGPILLVGPAALASDDRIDLAFRLGRAMSFLLPGRAIGGSRPSRLLKAMLIACMSLTNEELLADDPDGTVVATHEWLSQQSDEFRQQVLALVATIIANQRAVNLSRWARALARTADRVGLLMCGDAAVAAKAASTMITPALLEELTAWSLSATHHDLRADVGVSIDV